MHLWNKKWKENTSVNINVTINLLKSIICLHMGGGKEFRSEIAWQPNVYKVQALKNLGLQVCDVHGAL